MFYICFIDRKLIFILIALE